MMKRKQLYIDDDLDRALKQVARSTDRSEASHVRAALREYLALHLELVDDPLAGLVGLVADPDGPDDVAEHHDRYLYEAAEGHAGYDT